MEFEEAIRKYFEQKSLTVKSIEKLGSGLVADGFLVVYKLQDGREEKTVCRKLRGGGMSHDYFSDSLAYLSMQHEISKVHPNHIRSQDVVVYNQAEVKSLDSLNEVFQILDFAEGDSFLKVMELISENFENQQDYLLKLIDYMRKVHAIEPSSDSHNLYLRHSQDFIGSQVLMDILDVWDLDSLLPIESRMELFANLTKLREESKLFSKRCRMIHADLHPDNIKIKNNGSLSVLDSARAMWGEPMDDLTSMLANFIYFSLARPNSNQEYKKGYKFLVNNYFANSVKISAEDNKLSRLFLPVRLLILAHPLFFPTDNGEIKRSLIKAALEIVKDQDFNLSNPWKYLNVA